MWTYVGLELRGKSRPGLQPTLSRSRICLVLASARNPTPYYGDKDLGARHGRQLPPPTGLHLRIRGRASAHFASRATMNSSLCPHTWLGLELPLTMSRSPSCWSSVTLLRPGVQPLRLRLFALLLVCSHLDVSSQLYCRKVWDPKST